MLMDGVPNSSLAKPDAKKRSSPAQKLLSTLFSTSWEDEEEELLKTVTVIPSKSVLSIAFTVKKFLAFSCLSVIVSSSSIIIPFS